MSRAGLLTVALAALAGLVIAFVIVMTRTADDAEGASGATTEPEAMLTASADVAHLDPLATVEGSAMTVSAMKEAVAESGG